VYCTSLYAKDCEVSLLYEQSENRTVTNGSLHPTEITRLKKKKKSYRVSISIAYLRVLPTFSIATMLSLEKTDKVREEVKAAAFSHIASLSFCCLKAFPAQLLANESLLTLRRLDLSHNHIAQIPDSISTLTNLKELWLQHNPLVEFPAGIPLMTKLEVIDISSTLIETIPAEMANLTKLYEVDWHSTPLAKTLLKFGIEVNDILKLRKHLLSLDTRKQLETQLFEYLEGEHYIQDADKKGIKTLILALVQVKGMLNCARSVTLLPILHVRVVQDISAEFDDLEELRQYVRRAGKFLPEKIEQVQYEGKTARESKVLFHDFRRDTDRARLAADVEIKVRITLICAVLFWLTGLFSCLRSYVGCISIVSSALKSLRCWMASTSTCTCWRTCSSSCSTLHRCCHPPWRRRPESASGRTLWPCRKT
jgi:hypothetical protein